MWRPASSSHGVCLQMNVQCTPAGPDEHQRLLALLQLYVYDFSEILPLDVAEEGRFHAASVTANLTEYSWTCKTSGGVPGGSTMVSRCCEEVAWPPAKGTCSRFTSWSPSSCANVATKFIRALRPAALLGLAKVAEEFTNAPV